MSLEGLACGLHRIERLMRQQGLKHARDGVGCRPIWVSGRPPPSLPTCSIALRGSCSQPTMDRRLHVCLDGGGLALRGRHDRSVLSARSGLVDERRYDGPARHRCARHGDSRRGKPDALLHHSDRGSQYASEQFQRLMADHGVVLSDIAEHKYCIAGSANLASLKTESSRPAGKDSRLI